jgi:glucose-1-phosphate adenylyltransferase
VLTQYKSHSLDRHITTTWRMSTLLGNYITPVPAQQRLGPQWYRGSADAIHQSLNLVYDERPEHVVVFGADHVYRMDPRQMVEQHVASGAGVTVAGIRVPRSEAHGFGVIQTAADGRRIEAFLEKPSDPPGLPDDPDTVFASMGNYVFTTEALLEAVQLDAGDEGSVHDMGGNIIPMMVERGAARVYDFKDNEVPGRPTRPPLLARRRDARRLLRVAHGPRVGPPGVQPLQPQVADPHQRPGAAAGEVRVPGRGADRSGPRLAGQPGVIVSGGCVRRSVLSPHVRVHTGADVDGSVLMHGVDVGRGRWCATRSSTRTSWSGRGASVGVDPGGRPGARLPRDRGRRDRHRKGGQVVV